AEFLPVIVSLRDLKAASTFTSTSVGGMALKRNEMNISAMLVSPFMLKDVFLVIEIDTPGGNGLFLGEVGTLRPYEAVPVKEAIPIPAYLGDIKYQVHVFSAGAEVFNSEMPFDYRESKLDQMVYSRIKDALVDSPARPFVGPGAEYPASMRGSGMKGEAVVTVHVTVRGTVADPVVKAATTPAFGEAALAAVRQWRYLPKISLGQPVESTFEVRFVFTPPAHGGT
ncbi:MAG TPA: energy transducer TonB, partial [Opitutaceae bacterium]